MIVDDLRLEPEGDRVELSARLRLRSSAEAPERIWFRFPQDMAGEGIDGSPFVPGLLMAAMYLGEELAIDAPVSARLLDGAESAKLVMRSWWPYMADVPVRGETAPLANGAGRRATLFTRGVDSWYTALTQPVDTWLYAPTADFAWGKRDSGPEETERLRRPVVEIHRSCAQRFDRRLVVVDTNLRHFVEPLRNWGYSHGGILTACGLAVGAQLGELRVPSSLGFGNLVPLGTHPLLDPHWSTERTRIVHDATEVSRMEKAVVVAENQHALDHLLVCNSPDPLINCGRCGMCLRTMAMLEPIGALERCPTFREPLSAWRLAMLPADNLLTRKMTGRRIRDMREHGARPALGAALRVGLLRYNLKSALQHLRGIVSGLLLRR